jgi:hypothetical protein
VPDCVLFHVLDDGERVRYVVSLAEMVPPGSVSHALLQRPPPGGWAPRRVAQVEISGCVSAGWEIESIQGAVFDLTWDPTGALACQVAAARR